MDRGNDHDSEKPDDDRAHGSVGISSGQSLRISGQPVRDHHHGVNHSERSIRRASSVVLPVRRPAQFVLVTMCRGATASRTTEEARRW